MNFLKNILNLFYPDVCLCCNNQLSTNELDICVACRNDLPLTNFCIEPNNFVEKTFYGRIPIENATSLFYFSKNGKVQQLIHQLKYKNQQQVGTILGHWLGNSIKSSTRFNSVDCIISVPLHYKKEQKRGYNQLTKFGEALANELDIPFYSNILVKQSATKTQSKKSRIDRWLNVEHVFVTETNNNLTNKHVLLIDDIITTGATLEACYLALKKYNNIKISIASMAFTKE